MHSVYGVFVILNRLENLVLFILKKCVLEGALHWICFTHFFGLGQCSIMRVGSFKSPAVLHPKLCGEWVLQVLWMLVY